MTRAGIVTELYRYPVKSLAGERDLPLPAPVLAALKSFKALQAKEEQARGAAMGSAFGDVDGSGDSGDSGDSAQESMDPTDLQLPKGFEKFLSGGGQG